jgi:DNA-binding FadR family transcriptional regulator
MASSAPPEPSRVPGLATLQVQTPKMAELVASSIRQQIIRGELSEGDALPTEAELIAHYGISRPTIREAFRILESESLITIRKGARGGAEIHRPSPAVAARYTGMLLQAAGTTLADVHVARTIIEPAAARMLAENFTPEASESLHAALEDERVGITNPDVFVSTSVAFHRLIVEHAGNRTLAVLWGTVALTIEAHVAAVVAKEMLGAGRQLQNRKGYRAHVHMLDLMKRGDPDAVEEFWRKHIDEAESWMVKRVGSPQLLDILG